MRARKRRSPLGNLMLAVAASLALVGGYYVGNLASGKKAVLHYVSALPEPRPLNEFSLNDSNGQPFGADQFRQHWSLVYFGYTSCPDICPLTLNHVVDINQALSEQLETGLQNVFVSVDPQRDTPRRMQDFLDYYRDNLQHSTLHGITGYDTQIRELASQLAVFYRHQPADENGFYTIDHSNYLLLIDPDARFHAIITADNFANPQGVAEDIALLMKNYQPAH